MTRSGWFFMLKLIYDVHMSVRVFLSLFDVY